MIKGLGLNMKIITVSKITQESFNKLIDAGFQVRIVPETDQPKPFAKYKYTQLERIKKIVEKKEVAPSEPSNPTSNAYIWFYKGE